MARAREAGIDRLVCIGTGVDTSRQAVDVARATARSGSSPRAWASIGLHPHEASEGVDEVAALLVREVSHGDGAVVAVGECGLDYYYEHSPRAAAARRVRVADRAGPHARPRTGRSTRATRGPTCSTCSTPRAFPNAQCCTASPAGRTRSDRCLRAGMYISFSGIVTFKNAADVRAAAAQCPLDRLLVETDSPFLAPVPHRGRQNEPSFLPFVGEAIAAVKGCSVDEVKEITAATATMVFSTGS